MRTEARTLGPLTPPSDSIPARRYALYGAIVSAGAAFDLWSKYAVFAALGGPWQPAPWVWRGGDIVRFTFQTSFNEGALWGLGQGFAGLFAALSCAAVVGILYFLFVAKHAHSVWLTVALSLVTAGALGNLFDRLGLHGWKTADGQPVYAVRDFLYFRFFETFDWAIFNIADALLVTGAIMLVIHSFWMAPATQPAEAHAAPSTPTV